VKKILGGERGSELESGKSKERDALTFPRTDCWRGRKFEEEEVERGAGGNLQKR